MSMFGRQPPSNLEAEQHLLGALLANNKAYDRVVDFLRPEHFVHPAHGRIYGEIAALVDTGRLADAVTLRHAMEASGALKEVGGPAYLAQLLGAMVGIINAGEYGKVVHDAWMRRELIALGSDIVNRAYGDADRGPEAMGQIPIAEDALYRLAQGDGAGSNIVSAEDAARQAMALMEQSLTSDDGLIGLTTGLRGIDRMTGGLKGGEFFVLAGRPSMGKTALGLRMGVGAADAGASVLFESAEMTASSLMARLIAADAKMPLGAVLRARVPDEQRPGEVRKLHQHEVDRLVLSQAAVGRLALKINETAKPSVAEIRSRARRMKRKQGLDLVIVDYLQKLRGSEIARGQNRTYEVSEIARDLKALAVELGVPVLALAQLSREVEKREDKTPVMSDLRDSGEIEQEADIIGLLYRSHYYLQKGEPSKQPRETQEKFEARHSQWIEDCLKAKGKADLILGKQRQGPTGRIRLRFEEQWTWFADPGDNNDAGHGPGGDE
jgi:replicative DNA helicase